MPAPAKRLVEIPPFRQRRSLVPLDEVEIDPALDKDVLVRARPLAGDMSKHERAHRATLPTAALAVADALRDVNLRRVAQSEPRR